MTYITITNGTLTIDRATDYSKLEALQRFVGGWVELVPGPDLSEDRSIVLYVNEEGRLKGFPANFYLPELNHVVVGPCVVCASIVTARISGEAANFDTGPLTAEEAARIVLVRYLNSSLPTFLIKGT